MFPILQFLTFIGGDCCLESKRKKVEDTPGIEPGFKHFTPIQVKAKHCTFGQILVYAIPLSSFPAMDR